MDNIKIVKISEINQEKLISFYEETFDEISSSEKDYKWKYRFDNGKCEPLIAIKNSKIIGHVGCYPTKFKINNVNHNGVWWSDVFVKKDYRGKGVAQLISKNLMNLSNFHAATCNEKSFKLLKKNGWSEAPAHYRLITFVPLTNFISFKAEDKFKETDLNEKNLLELVGQVEKTNNLKQNCFVRDEKWFEWRFLKYPNKHKLVLLKYETNFIIGLQTKWKKLKVFKILFANNKLDKNLNNMLSLWCKSNKFTFFSFVEKRIAEKKFYLSGKKIKYLTFSNLKEFDINFTKSFDEMQFADSDMGF